MNKKVMYALVCLLCGALIVGVGVVYGTSLPIYVAMGIFAVGGTICFVGVHIIDDLLEERHRRRSDERKAVTSKERVAP